jgi:hypothetical protein
MRQKIKYVAVYAFGAMAGAIAFMALFSAAAGKDDSMSQRAMSGFDFGQHQGKKIKSIVVGETDPGITLTFSDGTVVLFGEEYYLEINVKKEKANTSREEISLTL